MICFLLSIIIIILFQKLFSDCGRIWRENQVLSEENKQHHFTYGCIGATVLNAAGLLLLLIKQVIMETLSISEIQKV